MNKAEAEVADKLEEAEEALREAKQLIVAEAKKQDDARYSSGVYAYGRLADAVKHKRLKLEAGKRT